VTRGPGDRGPGDPGARGPGPGIHVSKILDSYHSRPSFKGKYAKSIQNVSKSEKSVLVAVLKVSSIQNVSKSENNEYPKKPKIDYPKISKTYPKDIPKYPK
jgi:hypothetical protein